MKPRQPHAPLRGFDRVVNGRNVHLLNVGDDAYPPVVLLHGCGSLAQEVLAPFRKTGLHIVAPDRPGYGLSDPLPQRLRGPLAQSLWLEDFVDALGFSSLTIAGHSIGCAPAILLARRRPDLVKSLVLIAPFCRRHRSRQCCCFGWPSLLGSAACSHNTSCIALPTILANE